MDISIIESVRWVSWERRHPQSFQDGNQQAPAVSGKGNFFLSFLVISNSSGWQRWCLYFFQCLSLQLTGCPLCRTTPRRLTQGHDRHESKQSEQRKLTEWSVRISSQAICYYCGQYWLPLPLVRCFTIDCDFDHSQQLSQLSSPMPFSLSYPHGHWSNNISLTTNSHQNNSLKCPGFATSKYEKLHCLGNLIISQPSPKYPW